MKLTRYERERTYMERRATELRATMQEAIESGNFEQFKTAFEKAGRYIRKRERDALLRKWIATESERRKANEVV